jgi:hypothetical protein
MEAGAWRLDSRAAAPSPVSGQPFWPGILPGESVATMDIFDQNGRKANGEMKQ